jgi:hypothetical protein
MCMGVCFAAFVSGVSSAWAVETARVETVGGVPTMVFDGAPVRSRIFWSRTDVVKPSATKGNPALEPQVKLAAGAGVNMVSFLYRDWWKTPDGKWDYRRLDEICDRILSANPHALLIPRPGLNAPTWWLDRNPDEGVVWKNNNPQQKENGWRWASPASMKYRREACEAMAEFVRHMEGKYGASVVGYHPYGQNTGEWFTPNTWLAGDADFGAAGVGAWHAWLKKKYPDDAALRLAWGDAGVTLDTAQVPSPELRNEVKASPLLDPAKDKRHQILFDYNVFFQSQMTDTILAIAKTVRETTRGRKMVWLFYGYNFEFSGVAKGPAASAHYNFRAVLDSPDVDAVCSPMSYFDRGLGGGGPCMLTAESVAAAGKMYIYEDDTRTHLAKSDRFPGYESGADTVEQSQALLRRDAGQSAVRNCGLWWMDLGGTGWFNDARLWQVMRELEPVDRYFLDHPTPYRPDIGVFLDEVSVLKITAGKYSSQMIGRAREPLDRLGAPYGQYLLDDLLNGTVKPPKLCVMFNPAAFDESQKNRIRQAAGNSALLWVGVEGLKPETLRQAAEKAGVFLYADKPCSVWANGPYVVLHAAGDGDIHVRMKSAPVCDAVTGEKISDSSEAVVSMKKGDTRILATRR